VQRYTKFYKAENQAVNLVKKHKIQTLKPSLTEDSIVGAGILTVKKNMNKVFKK
jgi:hypothetical protein